MNVAGDVVVLDSRPLNLCLESNAMIKVQLDWIDGRVETISVTAPPDTITRELWYVFDRTDEMNGGMLVYKQREVRIRAHGDI